MVHTTQSPANNNAFPRTYTRRSHDYPLYSISNTIFPSKCFKVALAIMMLGRFILTLLWVITWNHWICFLYLLKVKCVISVDCRNNDWCLTLSAIGWSNSPIPEWPHWTKQCYYFCPFVVRNAVTYITHTEWPVGIIALYESVTECIKVTSIRASMKATCVAVTFTLQALQITP